MHMTNKLLVDDKHWTTPQIERMFEEIQIIALEDLKLDVYRNQFRIVPDDQMLKAMASSGLPINYDHWSHEMEYLKLKQKRDSGGGTPYELVINSDPCISFNMESNSAAMHALVIAHAAFGHNHFFKNNFLMRQWTDAKAIIPLLKQARAFVLDCEEKYGMRAVEEVLDAGHAIGFDGVSRTPNKRIYESERSKNQRHFEAWMNQKNLDAQMEGLVSPKPVEQSEVSAREAAFAQRQKQMGLPENNLFEFIAAYSPNQNLAHWQRRLLLMVGEIKQYFWPNIQTNMMNEGCATFVHNYISGKLDEQGKMSNAAMLEIKESNSMVIFQMDHHMFKINPETGEQEISGAQFNPYFLGESLANEIKRVSMEPTSEDYEWFDNSSFVGNGDWRSAVKEAWATSSNASGVRQYMTPHLMRKLHMFSMNIEPEYGLEVTATHIDGRKGYERIRSTLADQYEVGNMIAGLSVVDYDRYGDRTLVLETLVRNGQMLVESELSEVLKHIHRLWGYGVILRGVDLDSDKILHETKCGVKEFKR